MACAEINARRRARRVRRYAIRRPLPSGEPLATVYLSRNERSAIKTALAITTAAAAVFTAAPAQACECAGLWENQMVCNALRDPATGDVTVASWLATRQGLLRDVPSYTHGTVTAIITEEVADDCPGLAAGVNEAIAHYQSAPYPTRQQWETQAQSQLSRVGWAPFGGVQ